MQARGENGLGRDELIAAHEAGLTRLPFGLESGTQLLNDSMAKGTRLERTSMFIQDAHAAGISVRTTRMLGYPGEEADDIRKTVSFLERHRELLDRVRLSRFKAIPASPFHARYTRAPERFSDLRRFTWDGRFARAHYEYAPALESEYRREKRRPSAPRSQSACCYRLALGAEPPRSTS